MYDANDALKFLNIVLDFHFSDDEETHLRASFDDAFVENKPLHVVAKDMYRDLYPAWGPESEAMFYERFGQYVSPGLLRGFDKGVPLDQLLGARITQKK